MSSGRHVFRRRCGYERKWRFGTYAACFAVGIGFSLFAALLAGTIGVVGLLSGDERVAVGNSLGSAVFFAGVAAVALRYRAGRYVMITETTCVIAANGRTSVFDHDEVSFVLARPAATFQKRDRSDPVRCMLSSGGEIRCQLVGSGMNNDSTEAGFTAALDRAGVEWWYTNTLLSRDGLRRLL